jgi:uncharacterized membrane protein
MSGGGDGPGVGWVGYGQGVVAAYIARRRARRQVLNSAEALLRDSGLPVPPSPKWFVRLWWSVREWGGPRQPRRGSPLRVIYAVCMLAGASTHAAMLWHHGLFWNYGGVPQFTQVYWTSLTFLDPFAALLLFVYPRVGLVATFAIISTDVAHNLWFFEHYHVPFNWMLAMQVAFLVFVAATFPIVWRSLKFDGPEVTKVVTL